MQRLDLGMVRLLGGLLGAGNGFLSLHGKLVETHHVHG
jgi:hypothetical protein